MNTLQNPNLRRSASIPLFWLVASAWFVASLMDSAFAQSSSEFTNGQMECAANHATIAVRRRPGLFGQNGVRYVIDRGSGVDRDAIIVEAIPFPDDVGDFCIPRNVVYFLATQPEALASNSSFKKGSSVIIGRSLRANLEPNAALVGKFDSHGFLTWTRPPGRMRLEVVNVNGNQSVCAPVEVEAGKSYEITIHYGDRTRFEVKSLSRSTSNGASTELTKTAH